MLYLLALEWEVEPCSSNDNNIAGSSFLHISGMLNVAKDTRIQFINRNIVYFNIISRKL